MRAHSNILFRQPELACSAVQNKAANTCYGRRLQRISLRALKNIYKYWRVWLMVFCMLWVHSRSHAEGEGGTSGAYLRLPMGAAATALGGAYTASPDYYATWWNPAVLANLHDHRLAAGTGIRSLGRMDGYGSFEFRVPPRVGMGLFALYRGAFLGKLYDLDENPLPTSTYTTLTFKAAVSYYMNRRLSVGACVNVLYQSLPLPNYDGSGGLHHVSSTGIGAFDFAAVYRISKVWTAAAVLKNIGANMEWQMGDYAPLVTDQPLPEIILGGSLLTSLAKKPLLWLIDCKAYVLNNKQRQLDHNEAVISTGAEWRRWENFYVRAGIGDVAVNSSIFRDSKQYSREFGMRITAGFSYDLSKKVRKGLWVNYGAATDKVWAGIDQQLDVTLSF